MAEGRLHALTACARGVWIGTLPSYPPRDFLDGHRGQVGEIGASPRTCLQHDHSVVVWDPAVLPECPLCALQAAVQAAAEGAER